jgi:signal transduction histidine kinase
VPFHRIRDVERLQALVGGMLLVEQDLDLAVVLRTIVSTAVELVGARYGALGVLDETGSGLAEFVHIGMTPEDVAAIGRLPEGRGLLGQLIKDPRPLRLEDLHRHPESVGFPPGHPPMGSFLGVPVLVRGEPYGNLYLSEKTAGGGFTTEDEDVVSALALTAALAIDKARVHARMRDLTLVEERERIARSLHDTTIRRLFSVGLALQGSRRLLGQAEASERLQYAIDELDDTIRQIRSTIFAITRPRHRSAGGTLEAEVLDLVEELATGSGLDVHVEFDGPIDAAVGRHAGDHLLVTVREVVGNAIRRGGLTSLEVDVVVDDNGLRLTVADDGDDPNGVPGPDLAALRERARLLGGQCTVAPRPGRGLAVEWRVARLQ